MHIARPFETSQLATRWFLSDITHGFTLRFHIHNSRIQDNCPFSCALFKAQVCFSFRVDASDGKCVFHSKRQVGHNESCFLRSHLRSIWAGLGRSETAFYRDFPGIDDLRAPFKLSRKTKSQLEEDGILGGDWEEYMITACFISFFFVMFSIISLHLLRGKTSSFPPSLLPHSGKAMDDVWARFFRRCLCFSPFSLHIQTFPCVMNTLLVPLMNTFAPFSTILMAIADGSAVFRFLVLSSRAFPLQLAAAQTTSYEDNGRNLCFTNQRVLPFNPFINLSICIQLHASTANSTRNSLFLPSASSLCAAIPLLPPADSTSPLTPFLVL
ncbi:hypothetical protein IWZ00DRAFT_145938 [Phyllosticta capitalensis]